MATASSAQRSSINLSVRTITPASRARRISTSVVFPARTGMRSPSRCSSTEPSTDTAITTAAYAPPLVRQLRVSPVSGVPPTIAPMAADPDNVIHQLAVADATAIAEIIERAQTSDDVTTMVAAALFAPRPPRT